MKKECMCQKCKDCCWHNPGWFGTVEEIEGAAKIMNISTKKFCQEYLIQEWMAGDDVENSIPSPRRNFDVKNKHEPYEHINSELSSIYKNMYKNDMLRNGKGFIRATWGHNSINGFPCIFLDKDNMCKIHKSKPQECREAFGCGLPGKNERGNILKYWKKHQNFIRGIVND